MLALLLFTIFLPQFTKGQDYLSEIEAIAAEVDNRVTTSEEEAATYNEPTSSIHVTSSIELTTTEPMPSNYEKLDHSTKEYFYSEPTTVTEKSNAEITLLLA